MQRPVHDTFLGVVIDALTRNNNVIRGQVRPTHYKKWVSALHVLTEECVGESLDEVQTGSRHHTEYRLISECVRELEDAGIIAVLRACGPRSHKANSIERIEVIS